MFLLKAKPNEAYLIYTSSLPYFCVEILFTECGPVCIEGGGGRANVAQMWRPKGVERVWLQNKVTKWAPVCYISS